MHSLLIKNQHNFNNASHTYDLVANAQRQAAIFLTNKIQELKHKTPATILDLGTGTGFMPELLLPIYPHAKYTLNDLAANMLEVCKQKFALQQNFSFMQGDMEQQELTSFDLIISNFALQWAQDLFAMLSNCHANAKQTFAFTTLLDGTFQEWEKILQEYAALKLQVYPTADELIAFCQSIQGSSSFTYWTVDMPLAFNNATAFLRYIKQLGAMASKDTMAPQVLKQLLATQQTQLIVHYKVFFGIFISH